MSDLEDKAAFLAGGSSVQGVVMYQGDRFLMFDENSPANISGIVGSGIFEIDSAKADGYFRPSDANFSNDFETGRTVVVQGGDFAGEWTYTGTFPAMTFLRAGYFTGIPPEILPPPTEAPKSIWPDIAGYESGGFTTTSPAYAPVGVKVRLRGIKGPSGSGSLTGTI